MPRRRKTVPKRSALDFVPKVSAARIALGDADAAGRAAEILGV